MSDASYNPAGSQSFDNDEYKLRADGGDSIGVRGGVDEKSAINAEREDRMAAESDATGRIPKGNLLLLQREAQSLISELRPEERDVSGRTRGVKVDAFKQERAVDEAVDEASSGRDAYNAGF